MKVERCWGHCAPKSHTDIPVQANVAHEGSSIFVEFVNINLYVFTCNVLSEKHYVAANLVGTFFKRL